MKEECGSCEYNRQCFIKKSVGIFKCEKEMNSYIQPNLAESLSILTATTQIICNILIAKKVITREEYDEFFSNENINEMEDMLLKEALRNLKENK